MFGVALELVSDQWNRRIGSVYQVQWASTRGVQIAGIKWTEYFPFNTQHNGYEYHYFEAARWPLTEVWNSFLDMPNTTVTGVGARNSCVDKPLNTRSQLNLFFPRLQPAWSVHQRASFLYFSCEWSQTGGKGLVVCGHCTGTQNSGKSEGTTWLS